MSIDTVTLKCSECGNGALERTGPNAYTCPYCKAVTVVEDDVSQRLDKVLDQVKNAAAARLANEQRAHGAMATKRAGLAGLVVLIFIGASTVVSLLTSRGTSQHQVVASSGGGTLPVSSLPITASREVVVAGAPKLLVTLRNTGDKPLQHTEVRTTFFAGDKRLSDDRDDVYPTIIAPGETTAVLIDLPAGATRSVPSITRLYAASDTRGGPKLTLTPARLVKQGNEVRLVGRIVNDREVSIGRAEVFVMAYDAAGAVVGIAHDYADAQTLAPTETTTVDADLTLASTAPIAAWDYRIQYHAPADQYGANIVSPDRVVRFSTPPETLSDAMHVTADDLVADPKERFDQTAIALEPLVAGHNNIHEPVYLTEIVNRSEDAIALNPGGVVSVFDGNKLDSTVSIGGTEALYPGERFPIRLEPKGNRITQTRVEWKPMRREALPGSRPKLSAHVEGTEAKMGSVLLNFSQRFSYKYVVVRGAARNDGTPVVAGATVWVSLRDAAGKLSGFESVKVPAMGSGDTAPFQVNVEQQGRDFKTVETFVTR